MMSEIQAVPLTATQRARLVLDCVPFVFFVVMLLLAATILDDIIGAPPSPFLFAFLGFVLLVTGFQAVQRLRDLLSGVAIVEEDVIERSWRSSGRGRMFFGQFQKLGRIRMMPKAHFQVRSGGRHRVSYSPVSRIVWTAEPLI
jgi:hypothetical protein